MVTCSCGALFEQRTPSCPLLNKRAALKHGLMTRQKRRGSNRNQSGRWSGKRDSNSQPSAWKADALAVELFPPMCRSPLTARTASYSYTSVKLVVGGGFEPPKSYDDRFTVCSLWPLGNPSTGDSHYRLLFLYPRCARCQTSSCASGVRRNRRPRKKGVFSAKRQS